MFFVVVRINSTGLARLLALYTKQTVFDLISLMDIPEYLPLTEPFSSAQRSFLIRQLGAISELVVLGLG